MGGEDKGGEEEIKVVAGGGGGGEGEKSVWVCKWGFGATKDTELNVGAGEEVEVLDPSNPDWWYVRSVATGNFLFLIF